MIKINDPEITLTFGELEEADQYEVVKAHADAFELKAMGKMEDIFRIGNPKMVLGKSEKGDTYCRIHKDSKDIMLLLTKQYL